jgi:hypothetical protein
MHPAFHGAGSVRTQAAKKYDPLSFDRPLPGDVLPMEAPRIAPAAYRRCPRDPCKAFDSAVRGCSFPRAGVCASKNQRGGIWLVEPSALEPPAHCA